AARRLRGLVQPRQGDRGNLSAIAAVRRSTGGHDDQLRPPRPGRAGRRRAPRAGTQRPAAPGADRLALAALPVELVATGAADGSRAVATARATRLRGLAARRLPTSGCAFLREWRLASVRVRPVSLLGAWHSADCPRSERLPSRGATRIRACSSRIPAWCLAFY